MPQHHCAAPAICQPAFSAVARLCAGGDVLSPAGDIDCLAEFARTSSTAAVNDYDDEGQAALHVAADKGSTEAISILTGKCTQRCVQDVRVPLQGSTQVCCRQGSRYTDHCAAGKRGQHSVSARQDSSKASPKVPLSACVAACCVQVMHVHLPCSTIFCLCPALYLAVRTP